MTQPYTTGAGYPPQMPASADSAARIWAGLGLIASLGVLSAPFLPWVQVSQKGFLFIPAQSQSWTAMDKLPEINNVPGYLTIAAGVLGVIICGSALATGKRSIGLAGVIPGLLGLAACGLFVQQLQSYQDKVQNDLVARLAQAVLDIKGGLDTGWFLAIACSTVLLPVSLGQLVRRPG